MSTTYHEPNLSEHARDLHRALASTIEELEAIDWYQQRIDATNDETLAAILAHNRDEEIEHMAMGLEWLRRKMPVMDEMLRTFLFKGDTPITEIEEGESEDTDTAEDGDSASRPGQGLGLSN